MINAYLIDIISYANEGNYQAASNLIRNHWWLDWRRYLSVDQQAKIDSLKPWPVDPTFGIVQHAKKPRRAA